MKNLIITCLLSSIGLFGQAQCNETVMEAYGATMGIAVYNTYLTIGGIADGYVGETYGADRVQELMAEQTGMLGTLVTTTESAMNTSNSGLSNDDIAYLKKVVSCLNHLKEEAQGLSNYSKNGSEESKNQYNQNRDLAWSEIEDLLGIGEE